MIALFRSSFLPFDLGHFFGGRRRKTEAVIALFTRLPDCLSLRRTPSVANVTRFTVELIFIQNYTRVASLMVIVLEFLVNVMLCLLKGMKFWLKLNSQEELSLRFTDQLSKSGNADRRLSVPSHVNAISSSRKEGKEEGGRLNKEGRWCTTTHSLLGLLLPAAGRTDSRSFRPKLACLQAER